MLNPSPDEIRAWGNSVIELMGYYLGGLRDGKVYPDATSREIRDQRRVFRYDSSNPSLA